MIKFRIVGAEALIAKLKKMQSGLFALNRYSTQLRQAATMHMGEERWEPLSESRARQTNRANAQISEIAQARRVGSWKFATRRQKRVRMTLSGKAIGFFHYGRKGQPSRRIFVDSGAFRQTLGPLLHKRAKVLARDDLGKR